MNPDFNKDWFLASLPPCAPLLGPVARNRSLVYVTPRLTVRVTDRRHCHITTAGLSPHLFDMERGSRSAEWPLEQPEPYILNQLSKTEIGVFSFSS